MQREPPTTEELDGPPEPTPYDDPRLWQRDPDEDGPEGMPPGAVNFQFGREPAPEPSRLRMTPEACHEALARQIDRWRNEGKPEITREDLADLTDPRSPVFIDRSIQWFYPVLAGLASAGVLEQHDRPRRWTIRKAA